MGGEAHGQLRHPSHEDGTAERAEVAEKASLIGKVWHGRLAHNNDSRVPPRAGCQKDVFSAFSAVRHPEIEALPQEVIPQLWVAKVVGNPEVCPMGMEPQSTQRSQRWRPARRAGTVRSRTPDFAAPLEC